MRFCLVVLRRILDFIPRLTDGDAAAFVAATSITRGLAVAYQAARLAAVRKLRWNWQLRERYQDEDVLPRTHSHTFLGIELDYDWDEAN